MICLHLLGPGKCGIDAPRMDVRIAVAEQVPAVAADSCVLKANLLRMNLAKPAGR
jgi:hypothetical protein